MYAFIRNIYTDNYRQAGGVPIRQVNIGLIGTTVEMPLK
jgi:hypothetical protein